MMPVSLPPPPPPASLCTAHLREPDGYLPLRLQPGPPFDNTNKVADLFMGTCGIIPTGRGAIVGYDHWVEVIVMVNNQQTLTGWVSAYYLQ
jgi:hypothetical protein